MRGKPSGEKKGRIDAEGCAHARMGLRDLEGFLWSDSKMLNSAFAISADRIVRQPLCRMIRLLFAHASDRSRLLADKWLRHIILLLLFRIFFLFIVFAARWHKIEYCPHYCNINGILGRRLQ